MLKAKVNILVLKVDSSLRTADAFPVVASIPPAVRRLGWQASDNFI